MGVRDDEVTAVFKRPELEAVEQLQVEGPPLPPRMDRQALFEGDWRTAPKHCGGQVNVWDQTIGCEECQMNLWYMPGSERGTKSGDQLPYWAPAETLMAVSIMDAAGTYDDEPFAALFYRVHPFIFDDCQDPGDEDDGDWPALELYLKAVAGSSPWASE